MNWPARILFVVTLVFFLPALTMGTVSPVVAKLAVDRLKRFKRTGTAIGQVYAWGMVGSILGTFLTGFVLIDVLGTKGVILVLGTIMAFGATLLGSVWHAVWAGIPLGLCVLAFTPPGLIDVVGKVLPRVNGAAFEDMGRRWGIREEKGDPNAPNAEYAWIDESNYYYIKVEQRARERRRDRAPHAGARQPDSRLLRARASRAARLRLRAHLRPGRLPRRQGQRQGDVQAGAGTGRARPNRRPQPRTRQPKEPVAPGPGQERTEASSRRSPLSQRAAPRPMPPRRPADSRACRPRATASKTRIKTRPPRAIPGKGDDSKDTEKERPLVLEEEREPSTPAVDQSSMKTLFLGGGAYCFQRYMQHAYPGTAVDVAEIDPAVTEANFMATGLPRDTTIKTHWGDARQFVETTPDDQQVRPHLRRRIQRLFGSVASHDP